MHIPDGFISPKTYIPAYIFFAGLISFGIKKIKKSFQNETIPYLSALTALGFILMMISIPLPGGTTGHGVGIIIIAILFNPWIAFYVFSLILLIQALLFGVGGITTFPLNAIGMGFVGGMSGYYAFKLLSKINSKFALFTAGWLSINISAIFIAIILGIQPLIAHSINGKPLFFPLGLDITIPAVMIPHLIIGIGEGIFTLIVYEFIRKFNKNRIPFEG